MHQPPVPRHRRARRLRSMSLATTWVVAAIATVATGPVLAAEALIVSPAKSSQHDAVATNADARASAQAMLSALVRVNGVPGMGASLWQDDTIAWTGSAGRRDVAAGLPVDAQTVFRLASVSKVFTTTAAAKLAQEGELDLDAPVTDALPWLDNGWPSISVRQIAAHASGLPHYQAQDGDRGQQHYATGRDAVRLFASRPLLSSPGTVYAYSSWGYTLMGAVIEARARRPFLDYITQVIAPGLRIVGDDGGRGDHVSRLYAIDDGGARPLPPSDFSYTWGGGGLAGTPAAVAAFGGRLMRGDIVSPATWEAMRIPLVLADGTLAHERDSAVALGWRVGVDADGHAIAHHAGVTDGARSALVLWPGEGVAVSLLSNASWVSSIERSAMLLAAPFRPTPAGLRPAQCPLQAQRYQGHVDAIEIAGRARFRMVDGRCVGELAPTGALGEAFADASAWPGRTLEVVSLAADGGLARAALVTPYGLYDLRAGLDGWEATLAKATLRIEFTDAAR